MILPSIRVLLAAVVVCPVMTGAAPALNEARSTLEKWVESRQLISKTKADWQSHKELLEQTIQALERELQSVEEQFGKLGVSNTQVDKERLAAELALKSSEVALEKAKQFAASFEGEINKVVPRLPGPLQDILKPLLSRIPADASVTKMSATERMQVIVGILNEVDKFNSGVSVFNEKQKNAKGEELAVDTVYVGLGAAYFVSESGDFAGTGTAGANGWEWSTIPEIGPAVKEVVRIYRNERAARFVPLPAVIR